MAREIDIETLLSRYAAGERDFSNLVVNQTTTGKIINLTKWQTSPNHDIDFTGADMRGASVNNKVFVCCNFTNVICDEDTSMFGTAFYGCDGDDFDGPILYETRFYSIDEWRR